MGYDVTGITLFLRTFSEVAPVERILTHVLLLCETA